jgi:hypothetical protein
VITSSLLFQLEHARRPSLVNGALIGVTFAAVMAVKDTGKVALALLPLSLLVFPWGDPARTRLLRRWAAGAALAYAMALAMIAFLRRSPYYDDLDDIQRGYGAIRPLGDAVRNPLGALEHEAPRIGDALATYLTWPVLLLAAAGAVLALRRTPRLALVVLGWLAVHGAMFVWVGLNFHPRYRGGSAGSGSPSLRAPSSARYRVCSCWRRTPSVRLHAAGSASPWL